MIKLIRIGLFSLEDSWILVDSIVSMPFRKSLRIWFLWTTVGQYYSQLKHLDGQCIMQQSRLLAVAEIDTSSISEQRLIMFLNEPGLFALYNKQKQFSGTSLTAALKNIYANQKIVRRFKALQDAKELTLTDRKVDVNIDFLINHLEQVEQTSAYDITQTQVQKEKLVERFQDLEMKGIDLRRDFENMNQLLEDSDRKFTTLLDMRSVVQKMLEKTEVVRGLTLSNKALRDQNSRLQRKLDESQRTILSLQSRLSSTRQ